jgi:hypothetical protein
VGGLEDKVTHRPLTAVGQLILEVVPPKKRCNVLIGHEKFFYARYAQAL